VDGDLFCRRLRFESLTPAPPPLSGINSTPAFSRQRPRVSTFVRLIIIWRIDRSSGLLFSSESQAEKPPTMRRATRNHQPMGKLQPIPSSYSALAFSPISTSRAAPRRETRNLSCRINTLASILADGPAKATRGLI